MSVIDELQAAAQSLRDAATVSCGECSYCKRNSPGCQSHLRTSTLDPLVALALADFLDHGTRISAKAILRDGEDDYTPGLPLMRIVRAINGAKP